MGKELGWAIWYNALNKYFEEYGNIDVPQSYVDSNGLKLGRWLCNQKTLYRENKLSTERIKQLEELGMVWNLQYRKWNVYYSALCDYYDKHGNINVLFDYQTEDGLKLGRWLNNQKQAYKGNGNCHISNEQIELLEKLNICWDLYNDKLCKYYYALREYYKKYGNTNVPLRYQTEDGLKLGAWLSSQRRDYRKKVLRKFNIQLLNNLNVDWSPRTTALLNSKITIDNKEKYYSYLNNRLSYVLDDASYQSGNQITDVNQEKLCKTLVKKIWG